MKNKLTIQRGNIDGAVRLALGFFAPRFSLVWFDLFEKHHAAKLESLPRWKRFSLLMGGNEELSKELREASKRAATREFKSIQNLLQKVHKNQL
jgi:hypothetical protein